MRYQDTSMRSSSASVLMLLIFSLMLGPQAEILCRTQTNNRPQPPSPARPAGDIQPPQETDKAKGKAKGPGLSNKKLTKPESPTEESGEEATRTAQEKEQMVRSTVEAILASAHRLVSVEYNVLVQVEGAGLLWELDRGRAYSVLRSAFDSLRRLQETKSDSQAQDPPAVERERLKAAVLRKVARINPELIKELTDKNLADDKARPAVTGDWTEEARAVLVAAYEQLDHDPALAAKLARESLEYGVVAIPDFLIRLSRRDRKLAEEQAMIHLSRLRESSVSPLFLLNFRRFVFSNGDSSPQLREHFFESLALRLRRDLRPDQVANKYEDLVQAARIGSQVSRGYPRWRAEFEQISSEFEALLATRALPIPGSARVNYIDMARTTAGEGETKEIAEAAARIKNTRYSKARDSEYKRLATDAALKSNVALAEELMARIEDEEIRRQATITVYSPLVRKAIVEADWAQAKTYAFRMTDPLGRSLVVDSIAHNMSQAGQGKQPVKELYDAALSHLQRDKPTQKVAKSYFILASSILPVDQDLSFTALSWAIFVLNKTADVRPFSWESDNAGELGTWVRMPTLMLKHEEVLEVTEIVGPIFKELAKRDLDDAQALAFGFANRGLGLLAQLGVVRAILEESKKTKTANKNSKVTLFTSPTTEEPFISNSLRDYPVRLNANR